MQANEPAFPDIIRKKMRILLLSMPNITPSSADSMLLPSLGIASLAGNIDLTAHQVKIADLVLRRKQYLSCLNDLMQQHQPQLVGLSGLTCSLHTALQIASFIKNKWPEIITVFGGYLALCHDDELIQPENAQWIDFLVRGEGEQTFSQLLDELDGNQNFAQVAGLSYKIDEKFVHNPPRKLADLATVKLPLRKARLLQQGFHFWGQPTDVVETSRGCTFDCAFCCVKHQYHRTFREFDLNRVISDIENCYALGTRFIVLVDDNITLDIKRLHQLCEELIHARFPGLRFFAQAAVKPIAQHPALIRKMSHAGFEVVFLGLENLIPRNLSFLNKKTSNYESAQKAVANLKNNDIVSAAGLIIGNPEDRAEDLWKNYRLVKSLKIDLPNFMTLTPFPKTKIRRELHDQGLLTNPDDYSKYDLIQANIRTKFMSEQELYHFAKLFFKKYYFSFQFLFFNRMIRKHWRFALQYALREIGHWVKTRFSNFLKLLQKNKI